MSILLKVLVPRAAHWGMISLHITDGEAANWAANSAVLVQYCKSRCRLLGKRFYQIVHPDGRILKVGEVV
jgi:hypothetical protein